MPAEPLCDRLDAITAWVESNATLPVLPDLAMRVISLASDPDATISRLTSLIAKDQVLSTRLLCVANSAYSASAAEVTTIADAVMRIGAHGVRNLAVTVGVASRLQDTGVYGTQGHALVDHAIGTAYLAHLIADEAGVDADQAFLCGLLHDIGKLVILKWHHEHVRRAREHIDAGALAETITRWHPKVAGLAFRRWGLPGELDEPVVCHHDFTKAVDAPRLSAVVYLANRLSHRHGFGCVGDGWEPRGDAVSARLGLRDSWFDALDAKAPGLFAVARQVLS